MSCNAAERRGTVVEGVMQDYSTYCREEIKFTCAVCSVSSISSMTLTYMWSKGVHACSILLAKMIVLFFPMGMVTKETHQVPLQSPPFSVYPGWQVQAYDPLVFVQVAFTWQEWFPLHSSISEKPLINFALYHFYDS